MKFIKFKVIDEMCCEITEYEPEDKQKAIDHAYNNQCILIGITEDKKEKFIKDWSC